MLNLWKPDLTLGVSLFDLCRRFGDAAIRRREDAKGNRDAGIEIQIAGIQVQRSLLVYLSLYERKTRRGLLLHLLEEGELEERLWDGLLGSLCSFKSSECR